MTHPDLTRRGRIIIGALTWAAILALGALIALPVVAVLARAGLIGGDL